MKDYLKFNLDAWNQKVPVHLESKFYFLDEFLSGRSSLNEIELALLGDVAGKTILHLQCHFGQDSISLARMGAMVVGVDFSDKAIKAGTELARQCETNVRFICSDVYELPQLLDEQFDIVFASYGTIGWLPDIDRWAEVVSHFLKPGGSLVFAEFHPVVWMFDDNFKEVAYSYFNSDEIIESTSGTYADPESSIQTKTITWNHGLAEVMQALIDKGLNIEMIREYDYSPYNCFSGTIEYKPGKFRIAALEDKLPMVYALKAVKN
jgi:ubiquinone/menaquinone biosynthesis C-methylase UbiE